MSLGAEMYTEQSALITQIDKHGAPKDGHVAVTNRRLVIGEVNEKGAVPYGKVSLAAVYRQPGSDHIAINLTSHVDDTTPIPLEAMRLMPIPKDEVTIEFMQGNWSAAKIELNLKDKSKPRAKVTVQDNRQVQYRFDLDLKGDPAVAVKELETIYVHNRGPNRAQFAVLLQAVSEAYEASGMKDHAQACREELQRQIPKITDHGNEADRQRAVDPKGGESTGIVDNSAAVLGRQAAH